MEIFRKEKTARRSIEFGIFSEPATKFVAEEIENHIQEMKTAFSQKRL